jgi:hypothetical protein
LRRWIEFVLDRPWLVIGVVIAITLGALSVFPRIEFDASFNAMIPDDDPVLLDLEAVAEEFGSQELFFIAIESDDIFTSSTLRKIASLEEELTALPGVADVQSPFNAQVVESSFFGIEIGAMAEQLPVTPEEIAQFKTDILNSPYEGVLVTADGRGAALLLELEDLPEPGPVLSQIEEIVAGYRGPEEIHMVGDSYIMYYTEQAMKQDVLVLVPFVIKCDLDGSHHDFPRDPHLPDYHGHAGDFGDCGHCLEHSYSQQVQRSIGRRNGQTGSLNRDLQGDHIACGHGGPDNFGRLCLAYHRLCPAYAGLWGAHCHWGFSRYGSFFEPGSGAADSGQRTQG